MKFPGDNSSLNKIPHSKTYSQTNRHTFTQTRTGYHTKHSAIGERACELQIKYGFIDCCFANAIQWALSAKWSLMCVLFICNLERENGPTAECSVDFVR